MGIALLLVDSRSWKLRNLGLTMVHLAANEMRLGAQNLKPSRDQAWFHHAHVSSSQDACVWQCHWEQMAPYGGGWTVQEEVE